jgi:5-methylcytosine-specific restriction protein A
LTRSKRYESDRRYVRENKNDPDRKFLQTRDWRDRIRPAQMAREPLCRHCKERGLLVPAEQVDHIIPPRGDPHLQRSFENMASLCTSCHAVKTRGKPIKGCDSEGWPLSKEHPWNRSGDGMRTKDFNFKSVDREG